MKRASSLRFALVLTLAACVGCDDGNGGRATQDEPLVSIDLNGEQWNLVFIADDCVAGIQRVEIGTVAVNQDGDSISFSGRTAFSGRVSTDQIVDLTGQFIGIVPGDGEVTIRITGSTIFVDEQAEIMSGDVSVDVGSCSSRAWRVEGTRQEGDSPLRGIELSLTCLGDGEYGMEWAVGDDVMTLGATRFRLQISVDGPEAWTDIFSVTAASGSRILGDVPNIHCYRMIAQADGNPDAEVLGEGRVGNGLRCRGGGETAECSGGGL
ncbi:MAG: hypothetical protein AAF517_05275 [Planctomycetota bacterium]